MRRAHHHSTTETQPPGQPPQPHKAKGQLTSQLGAVIAEFTGALGFAPITRLEGPVDLLRRDVTVDLLAVLREALTNVAQHAHAHSAEVEVVVAAGSVTLRVVDDGVGLAGATTDGGVADLRRRAAWHGGRLTLQPGASGGTRLSWTVPL